MSEIMTGGFSEDILVSSSAELASAIRMLSEGQGGTIRVVNSGEAYSLQSYMRGSAEADIRIVSADPGDPALFSTIKLNKCTNLTFEGLTFDSSDTPDPSGRDLEIYSSTNIRFIGNTFLSNANGFYDGTDPTVQTGKSVASVIGNTGFVFQDNTVSNYFHALAIRDSTDTVLSSNDFSQLIGDGMRLSGMIDTVIEGNTFSRFFGSTQLVNHDDMIQVWSAPNNTQNTENLLIRDNVFNSAGGAATQSIFIKNEMIAQTGQPYLNITIENNTIYNGHTNGIVISDTIGVTVSHNTLLWDKYAIMLYSSESAPANSAPSIHLSNVEEGLVENNIAARITVPEDAAGDNVRVSYGQSSAADHVDRHFVNAQAHGEVALADLALLPDSPWAGRYGAPTMSEWFGVKAVARYDAVKDMPNTFIYDAALSFDANGVLDPAATTYLWTFADGTVDEGVRVLRSFSETGPQDVTLTVHTAAESDTVQYRTMVRDELLLALDFDGPLADASSYQSSLRVAGTDTVVEGLDGGGFRLGGENKLYVERENTQFRSLDAFTIDLSLKRDEGGKAGTFMHVHKAFRASVEDDGSVRFAVSTDVGAYNVQSAARLIGDTDWHRITLIFDGGATADPGILIHVDGQEVAAGVASGTMIALPNYHLVLGHSWTDSLQATVDSVTIHNGVYLPDTGAAAPLMSPGAMPVPVPDPGLLWLDFDSGVQDGSGQDTALWVRDGQESAAAGVRGAGFALDGTSDLFIGRDNAQFRDLDQFSIALSLQRAETAGAGTFLHAHKSLNAHVEADGLLRFKFGTDAGGGFVAETAPGALSESDWHRIVATYDGEAMSLYVDGQKAGETAATGRFALSEKYHLVLGNTWGSSLRGVVDDFEIHDQVLSAAEVAQDFENRMAPLLAEDAFMFV